MIVFKLAILFLLQVNNINLSMGLSLPEHENQQVHSISSSTLHREIMEDAKVNRYNNVNGLNTWEEYRVFCLEKGGILPTFEQMCPDGVGDIARGNLNVDRWSAINSPFNEWVNLGSWGSRLCITHTQMYAGVLLPARDINNSVPVGYFPYIFCTEVSVKFFVSF